MSNFKKMLAVADQIMEVHGGGKISILQLMSHNLNERAKMECEDHGEFYETVFVLLSGSGCPDCAKGVPPYPTI